MNLLKQIGLWVPAIRRLHDERNRYAQVNQALEEELASVREKHGALQTQFDAVLRSSLLQREDRNRDEYVEMLMAYVEKSFARMLYGVEDIYRESFLLKRNESKDIFTNDFQLETDAPIAVGSDDHKHPRGARNDNT